MRTMFIRLYRPGTRVYSTAVPVARLTEIVEEYRLLGWDVSW